LNKIVRVKNNLIKTVNNHRVNFLTTSKKMPTRLIAEMFYTSVYWLKSFPSENSISITPNPKALVTGCKPAITIAAHLSLAHMCKHMEHTTTQWRLGQLAL